MERDVLLEWLRQYLEVDRFKDYCVNGLQIEGRREIHNVVVGVSVSQRLIDEAVAAGADLLLVHHGLFWADQPHPFALRGLTARRTKALLEADVNLMAFHLPLDAHLEVGNNIALIQALGALPGATFDGVGYLAELPQPEKLDAFLERLSRAELPPNHVFDYGPSRIQRFAVSSGGGAGRLEAAVALGAELFLTGEVSEPIPRRAEELSVHMIASGHYRTERLGVIRLGEQLATRFGLKVTFLEVENPL